VEGSSEYGIELSGSMSGCPMNGSSRRAQLREYVSKFKKSPRLSTTRRFITLLLSLILRHRTYKRTTEIQSQCHILFL
jgi:hypothetical protein